MVFEGLEPPVGDITDLSETSKDKLMYRNVSGKYGYFGRQPLFLGSKFA